MFNLDLKRAEAALDAGRLDDAFRILQTSEAAKHSRGQQLVDRLIELLLDRSQLHFESNNFQQARRDAERAQKLGGGQLQIAQAMQQVDAKDHSIANRASEQADQQLLDEVSTLVSESKYEAAVERYRAIRRSRPIAEQAKKLIEPAVKHLTDQVQADLVTGRLDRCEATLRTLSDAGLLGQTQRELKNQLQRCYNICAAVEQSDYTAAIRDLRLLAQVIPNADWVGQIVDSVQQCLENVERVKASPFGLLNQPVGGPMKGQPFADAIGRAAEPAALRNRFDCQLKPSRSPLKSIRSILQVDQLGSLMIVEGDVCSIGGATSRRCDVSLQTDGVNDQVLVCRDGEDYFASSATAFFVNDILAQKHLLTDGDTIHVGSRGRLKFAQPVPASTTAILHITGSKLKRRDVRSIVLLADAIVFGRRRGHFRLPDGQASVILRSQAERPGEFLIHQQGSQDCQMLSTGDSLKINDCHFALESTESTGGVS